MLYSRFYGVLLAIVIVGYEASALVQPLVSPSS